MQTEQSGGFGDVFKGAVAIVSQEGFGLMTGRSKPGAPHHKNVGKAVVVIIRLHYLESTRQPLQSCLYRPLGKGSVAVISEKAQLSLQIPVGHHQVQISVSVKIFRDAAARQTVHIETNFAGNIRETLDIIIRFENLR